MELFPLVVIAYGCRFVQPSLDAFALESLPIAVELGLRLPIVYNTSGFDALESLRWMDGIVDIYMPDFKYWTPEASRKYLKSTRYPDAAIIAIREMQRQVGHLVFGPDGLAKRGLLVRHLVMPGCLDETRQIFRFLAKEISPDTYVNIMDQYHPAGKVSALKYSEINRCTRPQEIDQAYALAVAAGLHRFDK